MSAYTAMLSELGHTVTGSDVRENARLERLRLLGVECTVPQRAENLPDALDAVIVSSAVPPSNVEVRAAAARGVRVLSRAEALAAMVAMRRGIGVAGTHGKTTTASMLTLVLRAAGARPSFLIGSELHDAGTNEGLDAGEWLVVEADESDGTFLSLPLETAIVTNVDHDHLWFWGSFEQLEAAFAEFLGGLRAPVVCVDDPFLRALAGARPDAVGYGFSEHARYRGREYRGGPTGSRVVVARDGVDLGELALPVVGRHLAQNAVGATAMALELGVEFAVVEQALAGYAGVARRFQHRGELRGAPIIDDYALLPPEVDATIRAAREVGYDRVVAVFQPFRYARTAIMWQEFADAFVAADQVVLTDVCGFHEQPVPGVTGELLVHAVLDAHPATPMLYVPHRGELATLVARHARPGSVILTLGGGDITTLADELVALVDRPS
jgi:UDP-N-acetylmuramate--alanine ligase